MITKKKLKNQVEELYNLLKETESNNASLKKRIDELQITIGARDFEINELKNEIEELKANNNSNRLYSVVAADNSAKSEQAEITEEVAPQTAVENIEVVAEATPQEEAAKYITNESLEDEISKYAAKAISNISLKAAMLSNTLAISGNKNAKDLLTLTLGRSEVFKQRVFEATKEGADIDAVKAAINLLEAETLEYFEQLKAQL